MLDQAEEIIETDGDMNLHRELLFGNPAACIMEVAEKRACDLDVMGTRGIGGLRGLLFGSQILKVISLARIPVLAVKI